MSKTGFFARQDRLRRMTRGLIVLTLIGAIGTAALGGGAAALAYIGTAGRRGGLIDPQELAGLVVLGAAATLVSTLLVMLVRLCLLHFSKHSAAGFFAARELDDATASNGDRVLLNVVHEMAIAANLTVPRIVVLDDDDTINSFAIAPLRGHAVIGVTAGARDALTRPELQAVIAHELGHLANGDGAINVRLLALVAGFRWMYDMSVTAIGWPLRTFESLKFGFFAAFYLTMLFGVFFVIGLFGVGIARLMQAAIARCREFLADASAVQFIRDTAALKSALLKADALQPRHPGRNAKRAAFMLFVSPYRARSWLFRTHPRIEDRQEALDAMTPGAALP